MTFKRKTVLLTAALGVLCASGCGEGDVKQATPTANLDCSGGGVIVDNRCVEERSSCRELGAWKEAFSYEPGEFSSTEEAHVAFDENGVLHACVVGERDGARQAVAIEQLPGGDFEEHVVVAESGEALGCDSIAVYGGRIFVLSSQPAKLAVFDGQWRAYDLPSLTNDEALAALRSDEARIRLTPDRRGGVYIGISLGMLLNSHRLYLAHFDGEEGRVFTQVNGFVPDAGETRGYSPQHLVGKDEVRVVFGSYASSDVLVTSGDVNPICRFEGLHPTSSFNDEVTTTLVQDRNGKMLLVENAGGQDSQTFEVGYRPAGMEDTPIWKIAKDDLGRTHVFGRDVERGLVEHMQIGEDGASTKTRLIEVGADGMSAPTVLELAVKTDMCARPGVAVVSIEENKTEGRHAVQLFEMR